MALESQRQEVPDQQLAGSQDPMELHEESFKQTQACTLSHRQAQSWIVKCLGLRALVTKNLHTSVVF